MWLLPFEWSAAVHRPRWDGQQGGEDGAHGQDDQRDREHAHEVADDEADHTRQSDDQLEKIFSLSLAIVVLDNNESNINTSLSFHSTNLPCKAFLVVTRTFFSDVI